MARRLPPHERIGLMQAAHNLYRQKFTQREIAQQLGVSQPTICQWLQRRDMEPYTVQQRAAAKIRAELVCCDIYQRMEDAYNPEDDAPWVALRHGREYHDICFYGEWAARLVEQVR